MSEVKDPSPKPTTGKAAAKKATGTQPAPPQKPKRPGLSEFARQSLLQGAAAHSAAIVDLPVDSHNVIARDIAVDLIDPSPYQPRKEFDPEYIEGLAKSIDERGLITPIEIRPKGGNRYELVCGECRLMSHKVLKKSFIKAHVVNISDEESSARALAENLNRKNLTDFEVFLSITKHREKFGKSTQNHEVLGLGRTEYFRLMSFDALPGPVILLLESRPGLLSGAAAEAYKTYSTQLVKEKRIEQATIDRTVKTVVQGAIDSKETRLKNLAAAVEALLFPKEFKARPKALQTDEGKTFGDIVRSGKYLKVKIEAEKLTDDKIEKLEAFLKQLHSEE
ncbi:TPA: ParB/RepB/Spo0J family partition protein [Pseudomonas aeruginosa]|jgi:ParB family chromosome partitioning protein|nr:ParB/RepB/Spo0J family partition protein [Pseudomonas aeruginosa]HDV6149053.1 ParB/RepB/Spo0J family partition protein [Pseudomonas aeruginosa]HDV6169466.1 ParB/RepB/Spo0J family partition protein [Pseudomonas aeruginosa]